MKKSDKTTLKDKILRKSRNMKVSQIRAEEIDVKIMVVDYFISNNRAVDIYGAEIDVPTSDGRVLLKVYGKNKNGAERLTRTIMDKLEVPYRIKK